MFGAFDIRPLDVCFFPRSISHSRDPITGFCASKFDTSLNNSSRGFSFLHTFFFYRVKLSPKTCLIMPITGHVQVNVSRAQMKILYIVR